MEYKNKPVRKEKKTKNYRQHKRMKARVIPTDNKEPIKNNQKNSGQTKAIFKARNFKPIAQEERLLTLEKFKGSDSQFSPLKLKKYSKLRSGLDTAAKILAFFIIIVGVVYFPQYLHKANSKTFDEMKKQMEAVQYVNYTLNEPIQMVSADGEDTGTITIKSVRVLQGKKPFIEITSEMTKKTENFDGSMIVFSSNGDFSKGGDEKEFDFSYEVNLSEKTQTSLKLKNSSVNWENEKIGTTKEVITYYKYDDSKKNLYIHLTTFIDGNWIEITIDLKSALENQE